MTKPTQPSNAYDVYGAPAGPALERLDARRAQSSVQTSIFSQLGRWPGARSGMAWDAVHAAQGGEKSGPAEARLSALDAGTLEVMLAAARKTRARAKDIYAQNLSSDVVAVIGRLLGLAAPMTASPVTGGALRAVPAPAPAPAMSDWRVVAVGPGGEMRPCMRSEVDALGEDWREGTAAELASFAALQSEDD